MVAPTNKTSNTAKTLHVAEFHSSFPSFKFFGSTFLLRKVEKRVLLISR